MVKISNEMEAIPDRFACVAMGGQWRGKGFRS